MSEHEDIQHLTRRTVRFLEKNRLILAACAGVIVLALGVTALQRHRLHSREESGWASLDAALGTPGEKRLAELEALRYTIPKSSARPWALLFLAGDYFEKGDWQRAEEVYQQAAEQDNKYVAGLALVGLACVYEEQGNYARAHKALERAEMVSGNSALILNRAGYRKGILDALEAQQRPRETEAEADTETSSEGAKELEESQEAEE